MTILKCQIIKISGLSDIRLKELCCTLALCNTNEKAFDITTKYLIKSFHQVTCNTQHSNSKASSAATTNFQCNSTVN